MREREKKEDKNVNTQKSLKCGQKLISLYQLKEKYTLKLIFDMF